MNLKEIIEIGLKEGLKRYNKLIKGREGLCAKDNMIIRSQLEAIQQELIKQQEKRGEDDK